MDNHTDHDGVSHKDTDHPSDERTAGFRADFLRHAAAAAEVGAWGVEGLSSGSAMLVVKRGPDVGTRFLLDQHVTSAGRHPSSDIYLDDVTVSRRHAEFRKDNGEFRIVDISSLNGTYLNKQSVQSALLANGDEISIGNFGLVFLIKPTRG